MILSTFYNKTNKALIITSLSEVKNHETKGDITYLYDSENNLVGMNIFNIEGYDNGVVKLKDEHLSLLSDFKDYSFGHVYGHILSCEPHPKSEKLQICQVDLKDEVVQIVCGASNCAANNLAVVAKVGAVMPSGMKIVASKLIDIDSNGMLCSEKELGLIDSQKQGIILLDVDTDKIAQSYEAV